ncbi:MAG TPA: hypothetical protein VF020_18700, partial [Chthoniobacterales bacterium]
GQSVLKGRWVGIRKGGRVCYAQWEDCGPFRTDHWQYVFGSERPKPNSNGGAGLDISPAVRDYLSLGDKDVCDWRFVESNQVPPGPWAIYGDRPAFADRQGSHQIQLKNQNPAANASRTTSLARFSDVTSDSTTWSVDRSF